MNSPKTEYPESVSPESTEDEPSKTKHYRHVERSQISLPTEPQKDGKPIEEEDLPFKTEPIRPLITSSDTPTREDRAGPFSPLGLNPALDSEPDIPCTFPTKKGQAVLLEITTLPEQQSDQDGPASRVTSFAPEFGSTPNLSITNPGITNPEPNTLDIYHPARVRFLSNEPRSTKTKDLIFLAWQIVVTLLALAALCFAIYSYTQSQTNEGDSYTMNTEINTESKDTKPAMDILSNTSVILSTHKSNLSSAGSCSPSSSTSASQTRTSHTSTLAISDQFCEHLKHSLIVDEAMYARDIEASKTRSTMTTTLGHATATTTYVPNTKEFSTTSTARPIRVVAGRRPAGAAAFHQSSASRIRIPPFLTAMTSLILFMNVGATAFSLTTPILTPTSPAAASATITGNIVTSTDPVPGASEIRNRPRGFDLFKEVEEKKDEVKSKGEEVIGHATSIAQDATSKGAEILSDVKSMMPDVEIKFEEFKVDLDFLKQASPELKREAAPAVESTSGAERSLDNLPGFLFWKWPMRIFFGTVCIFSLMFFILFLVLVQPIHEFWKLFKDIRGKWDDIKKLAGGLDDMRKDVEEHLKKFWEEKIQGGFLDNIDKLENWLIEAFSPLKNIPGLNSFSIKKPGKKGRKRDTLLLDASPRSADDNDDMVISISPELVSEAKSFASEHSTLLGSHTIPAGILPPSTTATSITSPTPTPTGNFSGVGLSNGTANIANATFLAVTAGAPSLGVLPLFTFFIRNRKTSKSWRQNHLHYHASHEPSRSYITIDGVNYNISESAEDDVDHECDSSGLHVPSD